MKQFNNLTIQQFNNDMSLSRRGFGLLEVLLASGILIMVIGAIVGLGRAAVRNNLISLQRAQAYNLARETVEIIRANRDTKWIDKQINDWNDDISSIGRTCIIDSYDINCASSDPEEIDLDKTVFKRNFSINKINNESNKELAKQTSGEFIDKDTNNNNAISTEITVKVVWDSYGKERKIEVPIELTNWKPAL